jgi:hypothetical protein
MPAIFLPSVAPEIFEPIGREFGVSGCVLNVLVTEVMLSTIWQCDADADDGSLRTCGIVADGRAHVLKVRRLVWEFFCQVVVWFVALTPEHAEG